MNNKDWFVDWFDTSWYHQLYRKRDHQEAQRFIDNLLGYLGAEQENWFLDLACGKGRHSIYLAEKGYNVVGLDLSPESIQAAQEMETEHLQFMVHDMRKKYPTQKFDFILNLFTSFGYFETDQEHLDVLLNMKDGLKEANSLLVLDFFNAQKVMKGLRKKEVIEDGETIFEISRKVESGFVKKKILVVEGNNKYEFSERVRLYTLDDFTTLFAQAGLSIMDVFGDYKLNPYNEDSTRLILIGQIASAPEE